MAKKDYMAMVSINRASVAKGTHLHGSKVSHSNVVTLSVHTGEVERNFNTEWYSQDKLICRIDFSYNQWAELISSMGLGNGVTGTFRSLNGKVCQDDVDADFIDSGNLIIEEYEQNVKELVSDFNSNMTEIEELLLGKKGSTVTARKEVFSKLFKLNQFMNANSKFVVDQFKKNADNITHQAKSEIEAFIDNRTRHIGLDNLEQLKIDNKKEDD